LSGVPELGKREMKKTCCSLIGNKRDGKDLEFLKWKKERWKYIPSIFGSLQIYFLCEIGKN